jgi:hypothetical protein
MGSTPVSRTIFFLTTRREMEKRCCMKFKTFLWDSRVLPLIGSAVLILAGCNRQDAERAAQREKELEVVRVELEQAKARAVALESDLARARNDNQELLGIRNDIRQLREDQQQLKQQVAPLLQADQSARQAAQQQEQQLQQLEAESRAAGGKDLAVLDTLTLAYAKAGRMVDALRTAQAAAELASQQQDRTIVPPERPDYLRIACINNLRRIDGAKQRWALDNRKPADAVPTEENLLPYLRGGVLPTCPAGGTYTLDAVSADPTCSIPGHAFPPP